MRDFISDKVKLSINSGDIALSKKAKNLGIVINCELFLIM